MVDKNPRFIGKEMGTPSEGGDEYGARSRAEQAYMDASVGAYDPKKKFSIIETEAIEERKKAERQLDPEGYKKKQIENLKKTGKMGLGLLPIAGTVVYWDEMSPVEKTISIGLDAVDVLTFMKGGSAGAVYRGASGIADSVSDTASVKNFKKTVSDVSQDLGEDLSEVSKAQDDLIIAIAKAEDKGLNTKTKNRLDQAEANFKNKHDKFLDKVVEVSEQNENVFGVVNKSDLTTADEHIINIKRTTEGVADQSEAIINAKNKLDNAISTDVYQIEKAVYGLEQATKAEKIIAKTRLKKINDDLKFLQESDFPYDDVKKLVDDKKRILQKIEELENVDARSLQKASLALSKLDTPTQELTDSLNWIKKKEAESLTSMKQMDLMGESDSFGGAVITKVDAPPKAPPGVGSTPKIKPGTTSKVVVGSGALTRLTSGESPGENITDPPGELETQFNTPGDPKIGSYGEEYDDAVETYAPEEFSTPGTTPGEDPMVSPGTTPGADPMVSPGTTPGEDPMVSPGTTPGADPFASPSPDASPSPGKSQFATSSPGTTPSPGKSQFATPSPGTTPSPFKVPTPKPTKTLDKTNTPPDTSRKSIFKPRSRDIKYELPGGKTLEPGVFPRVIRFESGINNQIIDLQTGKRIYLDRKTPSTRDSADTFEVLKTSKIKPKDRTFSQGIVNINVTGRGIDFKKKL